MEGDLWEFYRIDIRDVFRGKLSTRRTWMFINRMLEEPTSRLRAEKFGRDFLWYGRDAAKFDDLIDHIKFLISAAGQNPKAKLRNPVDRPAVEQKAARSIADMGGALAGLAAQINS